VAPSGLTGEITPAVLTINGMTANSRVYNVDYDAVSDSYGRKAAVTGGMLAGVFVTRSASPLPMRRLPIKTSALPRV
jgi:hypothetical protein